MVSIEHHPSHGRQRNQFLGYQLRGVEAVERKLTGLLFVEQLDGEFPFREVSSLNRLPEVSAMKIRIRACDLDRLIPHERLQA